MFFFWSICGSSSLRLTSSSDAAHRVAGAQQLDLILVVADGEVGLRLLDLLVDLVEFELLFFDARDHFGIVELDDQILLLRERAERRDAASPARCRTDSARSASTERTARSSPRAKVRTTTSPLRTLVRRNLTLPLRHRLGTASSPSSRRRRPPPEQSIE